MKKIDLHIHSTFSDGELTPREILDYCSNNNINTIAITDHENFLESYEASKIISNYPDLKFISGIEIEAEHPSQSLHILGYGFSYESKKLNDLSNAIMFDRKRFAKSLVHELYKYYGFSFKDEDLEVLFNMKGSLGKPHIAKLCVKYGYISSVKEAFKVHFKFLKGKTIKKEVIPTAQECIDAIKEAGGIVSLAHPITLKLNETELFDYIKTLANFGIESVEVYNSSMSKEYSSMLIKYTNKLRLLQSGGSDYHGPIVKPNIEIGRGLNDNIDIRELSILSRL